MSVRTAAKYLREKGLIDGELFEVELLSKLRELRDVLYGDVAFKDQNSSGDICRCDSDADMQDCKCDAELWYNTTAYII